MVAVKDRRKVGHRAEGIKVRRPDQGMESLHQVLKVVRRLYIGCSPRRDL